MGGDTVILHAYIHKDKETGLFYSTTAELSGVFSQGETIDECIRNTKEAIELALEDPQDREYFGVEGSEFTIEYIVEGDVIYVR